MEVFLSRREEGRLGKSAAFRRKYVCLYERMLSLAIRVSVVRLSGLDVGTSSRVLSLDETVSSVCPFQCFLVLLGGDED